MTMLVNNAALTAHANAIRKLGKQTVENVIEIGRHLVEAKAEVKKLGGSWGDWLKHEFNMPETTARRFTSVFERKSELATVANADLDLKSIYLLAAPSTSKAARDEVTTRVKNGEKVKHQEVAAVVKKHKGKERKPVSGVAADVEAAVKAAGNKGLTTDEAKVKFEGKHHPQTVNSALNGLAKKDRVRDSGEKRQGRAANGRPSVVYVYNPDPQPKKKKPDKKAAVVDLNEHRVLAMIEDDSICAILAKWAKGKSERERGRKAYRLIRPLIGRESKKNLAEFMRTSIFGGGLAEEEAKSWREDGLTIPFAELKAN